MIQLIVDLPDITSLKDKRQIIRSLKDRMIRKYRVSFAETDLQDSLRFGQLGGAIVSNDKTFGESIMNKILNDIERNLPGRIHDVAIHSEEF